MFYRNKMLIVNYSLKFEFTKQLNFLKFSLIFLSYISVKNLSIVQVSYIIMQLFILGFIFEQRKHVIVNT